MLSWLAFDPLPGFRLHLAASGRGLCNVSMAMGDEQFLAGLCRMFGACREAANDPILRDSRTQLAEYFDGRRRQFNLPLDLRGTAFQHSVWDALLTIPYGETRSYLDIARQIGRPTACRAVGAANGSNPVAIVVPCHRVIASNGTLCGFGGGLDRKRLLLDLEAAQPQLPLTAQRARSASR